MNNTTKQTQKSGDNSVNVQINHYGVSLSDTQKLVKQEVESHINIILKDNFIKLREEALACANNRANELTQMFFDKLLKMPHEIFTQVLERLKAPAVQMSILDAQKGYIKSGQRDKLEILSSLLKDKVTENSETLKTYLIDDALVVVPKLTKRHIDFLTTLLSIAISVNKVSNFESLKTIVLDKIISLCNNIQIGDNDLKYLSQLSCVEIKQMETRWELYKILLSNYQGLFAAGLEDKDLNWPLLNKIKPGIVMPCLNNPQKKQISALNDIVLEKQLSQCNLSVEERTQIQTYFNKTLSKNEIITKLKEIIPNIEDISSKLDKYNHIFLTPLGTLIALADYKEKFNEPVEWNF